MSASRGTVESSADHVAEVAARLAAEGLAVQDGFLTPAATRELVSCVRARDGRGELELARVGGPGAARRIAEIRGDSICWIVPPLRAAEERLLGDLEELRLALNRTAQLGLFELDLHYACYPAGAGYARHVDRPQGRERRCISLVLYLNETWASDAGGELRITEPAGRHRDIEPIAGRLVCFVSAAREHEVLPARRERLSISGWYSTRA